MDVRLAGGLVHRFCRLVMCAQSVSGERDRKTWDFQRTTSLTTAELSQSAECWANRC